MKRWINGLSNAQMKVLAVTYIMFLILLGSGIIYILENSGIFDSEVEKKVTNSTASEQQTGWSNSGAKVVSVDTVSHPAQTSGQTQVKTETMIITQYIYVGDSRYVAMGKYATINDIFIARVGVGTDFFMSNYDMIKAYDSENTAFIIGLGVNNLGVNVQEYARQLNEFAASIKGRLCVTLVAPVDEVAVHNSGYNLTNQAISNFNNNLVNNLSSSVLVVDLYAYLMQNGFGTMDGLHYSTDTDQRIHTYVKEVVDNNL